MTTVSREELDLHYQWMDERWNGYIKIIDARLDRQAAQHAEWKAGQEALLTQWTASSEKLANERQARADENLSHFRELVGEIKTENAAIKADIAEVRTESKKDFQNMRWFIVTTAIAVVGAMAAFNATVLSNMLSTFDTGRETALAIASATEQLKQMQADALQAASDRRTRADNLSAQKAASDDLDQN